MADEIHFRDAKVYSITDVTVQGVVADVAEIKTAVEKIEKALIGNGEPSTGVIWRVKKLEDWSRVMDRRALIHAGVSAINLFILFYLLLRLGLI